MFIMRLPSIFFMLALAFYYIPKLFKQHHSLYRTAHMITGALSAVTMVMAMCFQIGTPKIGKYMIFTIIMALITWTGVLLLKNGKTMRKLHLLSTLSFFVVLFGSIFLSKLT